MKTKTLSEEWLTQYPRPATKQAYQRAIRVFLRWCEEEGLEPLELERSQANTYRDQLADRLAPASVDLQVAACKSFYRYCIEQGELAANPFAYVRRLSKNGVSLTPWLDRSELKTLLDAARDYDRTGRDLTMCSLLGLNGLRISEVLGAEVVDLGTRAGHRTIEVERKGGAIAVVPLAPAVSATIDSYLDGRKDGPLIVRLDSRGGIYQPLSPISRTSACARVKLLAQWVGLNPGISPHSLRHSFVTLALQGGAPLQVVQEAAGHATPETTQRYNREAAALEANPTFELAGVIGG